MSQMTFRHIHHTDALTEMVEQPDPTLKLRIVQQLMFSMGFSEIMNQIGNAIDDIEKHYLTVSESNQGTVADTAGATGETG